MSNFSWKPISSNGKIACHQAKVGEFRAQVWERTYGGWLFSFAGETDGIGYDTKEIAIAACEIRGIHWIVSACNALGYTVRVPKE